MSSVICISFTKAFRLYVASFFNNPPSKPVKPIVIQLFKFAYLIALITFMEFPLPEIPITTSPGFIKFLSCSRNTTSYEISFE